VVTAVLATTVLLTAAYSFWMLTYTSSSTAVDGPTLADATRIEQTTLLYLLIPNLILGIYPSAIEGPLMASCINLLY